MSYKVVVTSEFAKEAKRIAKKHPGIKTDIAKLITDLANNPALGTELAIISTRSVCPSPARTKVNLVEQGLLLM